MLELLTSQITMHGGSQKDSSQFHSTSNGHVPEMIYKQINEVYVLQFKHDLLLWIVGVADVVYPFFQ